MYGVSLEFIDKQILATKTDYWLVVSDIIRPNIQIKDILLLNFTDHQFLFLNFT